MSYWNDPIHPGKILADELEEIGINASLLAQSIGVTKNRIYQIIRGQRSITADTAIRLGRFFGNSPQFWLNLQQSYELEKAKESFSEEVLSNIIPFTQIQQQVQSERQ